MLRYNWVEMLNFFKAFLAGLIPSNNPKYIISFFQVPEKEDAEFRGEGDGDKVDDGGKCDGKRESCGKRKEMSWEKRERYGKRKEYGKQMGMQFSQMAPTYMAQLCSPPAPL